MHKKITIGLVGCGDISRFVALGALLNRNIKIAACVDLSLEKAMSFSKKFRIPKYFQNYTEMIKTIPLDAVYLAVPHYLHFPMIKEAIENKVPVFCEKPITITLDDAMNLCEIVKQKNIKVGVNYQYRYDSGCYALASASRKKAMGEILYGRCNVPWHRNDDYFQVSPWHGSKDKSGGGTLITQASHVLDIMLWGFDSKPIAVMGKTANRKFKSSEVEDLCMAAVEMSDGSLIQLSSSMIATPEQPVTMEFYGTKGTGTYRGPWFPRAVFKGIKVKKEKPPVKGLHALFRSLEGFRQWVVMDKPFLTPIEASLPVLAVIDAIYKSAQNGKKVVVDQRYLEYEENR